MAKSLTIQIPDELEQKLERQAEKLQVSVEDFVLQSLVKSVETEYLPENDPILALAGTLHLGTTDLSQNHDRYISEALAKDLSPNE
ncbi:MAG: hypothetical protein NW220_19635 [Leptolyngbyaceae cyanobacterium bins.349]|nr:hypothetical protein [Leptolyngbyaceae cyanobacterium bins.349]